MTVSSALPHQLPPASTGAAVLRTPAPLPERSLSLTVVVLVSLPSNPTNTPVLLPVMVLLWMSALVPGAKKVETRMPAEVEPSEEATPRLFVIVLPEASTVAPPLMSSA